MSRNRATLLDTKITATNPSVASRDSPGAASGGAGRDDYGLATGLLRVFLVVVERGDSERKVIQGMRTGERGAGLHPTVNSFATGQLRVFDREREE